MALLYADASALLKLVRARCRERFAAMAEPGLRTRDAIHVAAAAGAGPPEGFVTYDERQAAAARLGGLRTVAPGG